MKRALKKLLIRAFNPLDFVVRCINGKSDLPPLHLRWDVGPLRGFETSSAEFRSYLKLLAGLKPEHRVLDIGCGCGQMALVLREELGPAGAYVGCDINREAVEWCRRHIARPDSRFSFHHLDVRNGMYNPGGKEDAAEFRFPPSWGTFDLILIKSVFTHMRSAETENYISQIPFLLNDNGRCLATFFLLNESQRAHEARKESLITFHRGGGDTAHAVPDLPEAITAYEEPAVLGMLERHHLAVLTPVYYGTWTGDRSRLSHQDIMLFHKNGMPG